MKESSEEIKKMVVRCRAIIMHEGKMLVVKHSSDADYYSFSGGHLEWGEGPQECLRREIVEELGITPGVGRLMYVHTFLQKDTHSLEFFFEITNGHQFINIDSRERTHAFELAEIRWVHPTDAVRILPEDIGNDFRSNNLFSDIPKFMTRRPA